MKNQKTIMKEVGHLGQGHHQGHVLTLHIKREVRQREPNPGCKSTNITLLVQIHCQGLAQGQGQRKQEEDQCQRNQKDHQRDIATHHIQDRIQTLL